MDPATTAGKSGLRYRFADFTLSPSRRTLLRAGREIPLIPRYFDLLLLLITQRNEAVHRQEILDRVWKDVVVSDGALTQAVRTLRRTLGDDSRNPSFISTVSRHGYRFIFADVVEEDDTDPLPLLPLSEATDGAQPSDSDPWELLLERLLNSVATDPETNEEEDNDGRREAAEALHLLGTSETLRRLEGREGNAAARSLLRDTRWDVPTAGPVPLLGESGGWLASYHLVRLRLRRATRLARRRWTAAVAGGALAGLLSGIAGAILLRFGPGSQATDAVLIALGVVGLVIGGVGAAGVGAGLAAAESLFRSFRGGALVLLGALGGGAVGAAAHLFGRLTLEGLF
jgi:DNA-binding winged helix-turn-helix (wHTH) protein